MAVTVRREPHELQLTKYRRFSPLLSSVLGDLHVLQVTYSTVGERDRGQSCDLAFCTDKRFWGGGTMRYPGGRKFEKGGKDEAVITY